MAHYYDEDGITIYHGDCREIIPSLSNVDAVITDPPYGISHNTAYRRFSGGKGYAELRNDHPPIVGDEGFDPSFLLGFPAVILWGFNCFSNKLPLGTCLVWDKRTTAGSTILSDAEMAWFSRGHGVYIFEHCWSGFARASETGKHYHPTQKPVALMEWCIGKVPKAEIILDPFMGSGPTLVAAQKKGRKAIGIEIEERYCEIAAKRLSQRVLSLQSRPADPRAPVAFPPS